MNFYYLKLYHEILDDPKMGQLPDHLWRRVIELFLVASARTARDGYLPPVKEIAWKLRADPAELLQDILEIESTGIIQQVDGCWHVTNFVKRQSAVSDAERQKSYRQRERISHDDSNDTVTDRNTELKLKIDIESELKTDSTAAAACYKAYTSEIGTITPMIGDAIDAELREGTPPDYITDAISEAARNNARNWAYIAAILKRWKVDGKKTRKRGAAGSPADYSDWAGDNENLPDISAREVNYWTKTIDTLGVDKALMEKLEHTKYIGIDGDRFLVGVPGADIDLVRSRIGPSAQRALVGVIGRQIKLQFVETY